MNMKIVLPVVVVIAVLAFVFMKMGGGSKAPETAVVGASPTPPPTPEPFLYAFYVNVDMPKNEFKRGDKFSAKVTVNSTSQRPFLFNSTQMRHTEFSTTSDYVKIDEPKNGGASRVIELAPNGSLSDTLKFVISPQTPAGKITFQVLFNPMWLESKDDDKPKILKEPALSNMVEIEVR